MQNVLSLTLDSIPGQNRVISAESHLLVRIVIEDHTKKYLQRLENCREG